MKRAIAATPVWSNYLNAIVETGKEFEMEDHEIDSLIEIGAAKEVSVKPKPVAKED